VWAPLGPAPLERFIESYRAHPPGVQHRLLVVMKGFAAGADRSPWRHVLASVAHDELDADAGALDLGTYRSVVERVPDAERFCFTNSTSVVLADSWLGHLDRHLRTPRVGLVGAAGSFESAYSVAPLWLRRRRRRDFPPFPNPHIRTNGFGISRELALSLDWPVTRRKLDALRLESGRWSITRQVLERGLHALVVGRDGVGYPPERWQESATFRSGDQRNLLIADRRTRQYEEVDPALRARFAEMAWG
jgi:hypothetical protein